MDGFSHASVPERVRPAIEKRARNYRAIEDLVVHFPVRFQSPHHQAFSCPRRRRFSH